MAREYKDVVVGLDIGTAKVMAVVAEVLPNGELKLAGLGVPSFACTPDAFPGLMAAAIRREDVAGWAAQQGLVTSRA